MLKLFTRYLKPYWPALSLVIILLLLQALANLYLPTLNAEIINNGVAKGDIDYIWRTGGLMLVITFLLGAGSIIAVYFGSRTAMAFGRDVRGAVFEQIQRFAQTEVNMFGAASLITRNTNDVQQLQMVLVMMLNVVILAPITMVGGIMMAIRQDPPLSTVIAVVLPIMAIIIGLALRTAMPLFQSMQKKLDRVNQVMREKLSGIRVIRAFVRSRYEEQRFDEASLDLMQTQLTVTRLFAMMMPTLQGIFFFSQVGIIWFGAYRVDSGGMPIGNLTAFIAYTAQILLSVMMAVIMFVLVPRAMASAERIQEVLDTEPSVFDPKDPVAETGKHGTLEFKNVEFRYPGAEDPVLVDVSFMANPGETTAIVGSTGSGKSTLINLIPRFYDVTGGSVLVDGIDVRQMERDRLWGKIGFIPQKSFLFSGTIASNLRYGKEDATEDEMWHALEVAQGRDFVCGLPEQLEAPIAQGGTNVSGGQRQRLAIARALVKRPGVYIFDDSFSALDFTTDAKLRAALKQETVDATVVIVAQRVSSIMDADRIIVMDRGRVVGVGTHSELLKNNGTYQEIVYSQLSEEEVA
ncbi:MAG: ABC transporter ATP-binding protein/permease [Coriobacteriia bacterium]|nr:ABC transporter ATP-binding protein/permease [Coriobacteriia bacterium]